MTRKIDGRTYLMRDTRPTTELRKLYAGFCQKYGNKLDFHAWLVQRGKVYLTVRKETL